MSPIADTDIDTKANSTKPFHDLTFSGIPTDIANFYKAFFQGVPTVIVAILELVIGIAITPAIVACFVLLVHLVVTKVWPFFTNFKRAWGIEGREARQRYMKLRNWDSEGGRTGSGQVDGVTGEANMSCWRRVGEVMVLMIC